MQQVEAAVFAGVGQRFIAGVDDGAVELHPFEQVVGDEIGALADLKRRAGPGRDNSRAFSAAAAAPTRPALV